MFLQPPHLFWQWGGEEEKEERNRTEHSSEHQGGACVSDRVRCWHYLSDGIFRIATFIALWILSRHRNSRKFVKLGFHECKCFPSLSDIQIVNFANVLLKWSVPPLGRLQLVEGTYQALGKIGKCNAKCRRQEDKNSKNNAKCKWQEDKNGKNNAKCRWQEDKNGKNNAKCRW